MTSTARSNGGGATGAMLRFLASLLPWADQADATERWNAAALSSPPRERGPLIRQAIRAVARADRRSPSDPGLAHVVALGRLGLAAAFSTASVLFLLSFGLAWIFGDPTGFAVVGGVIGLAWAVAAAVLLRLVVPVLGSRARLLFVVEALALAVVVLSAAVSGTAPSEAAILLTLAAAVVMGCALAALSWSFHLGTAGRGARNAYRVAPLALGLVAVAIACGVTAFVVRPLLAAPGMSLGEIAAALAATTDGTALMTVNIVWSAVVVTGVAGTILVLSLGSRGGWLRSSSARALAGAAGVALIVFEFFLSVSTVQSITDLPIVTGTDEAATLVLGVVGLALAAFSLLEGARHPYPSPRALAA